MSDRAYQNRIDVLRTRPIRPPFQDVAQLISRANRKAAIGFSFLIKFFAVLFITSAAAIGAYFYFSLPNDAIVGSKSSSGLNSMSRSDLSSRGYISQVQSSSPAKQTPMLQHPQPQAPSTTHSRENYLKPQPVEEEKGTVPQLVVSKEEPTLHECVIENSPFISQPKNNMAKPKLLLNSNRDEESNFFMDAGGALSNQFSSNSQLRQTSFTDAFLGIGYQLSPNSSFKLLGGEEVFMVPGSTTINTITFTDTVLVHDSVKYQNVIGQIQSTNQPGAVRTYWIGGSYRYTLTAMNLEPYAEIFGGTATQGGIAGASIGLTLFETYPISLDAAAFYHALFPVSGPTLTKFGANIELQYSF